MTSEFFTSQMQRLYGLGWKKSYPDERLNSIWRYCKNLPDQSFKWIVDRFVDTAKAAPLPGEFKMLANAEMDRAGIRGIKEPESKPSKIAKCWDCADAGNLYARSKATGASGVFRCHCEAGARRPSAQGYQWDQKCDANYDKEPIFEKGKGDWRPRPGQDVIDMLNGLTKTPVERSRKGKLEKVSFKKPDGEGPGAA